MGKITAVQTSSSDNIDDNLKEVRAAILEAAESGSDLVVLPECFAFMQSRRSQLLDNAEEKGNGPIQEFLQQISRESKTWIVAGSIPLKSDHPDKISNTLIVYNSDGQVVTLYSKIFLFDVELGNGERYFESGYTVPGNKLQIADTPVGCVGLSICYDLRFPEMYRKLTEMGAEILVVPSAFSFTTGSAHWLPLLQARAIENGCYVVAPAQTGIHNGKRKTWGHTVIIDPWGCVVSELESEPGLISAEIDKQLINNTREKLPTHSHHRPELFS